MCFLPSSNTPGAAPPAPSNNVADNLQLGATNVQQRNAALLGRLALQAPKAPAVTPGASPAPGGATTPAGTLGLPADMGGTGPNAGKPGVPNYGVKA